MFAPLLGEQDEVCCAPGRALQSKDQPQLNVWSSGEENPWV